MDDSVIYSSVDSVVEGKDDTVNDNTVDDSVDNTVDNNDDTVNPPPSYTQSLWSSGHAVHVREYLRVEPRCSSISKRSTYRRSMIVIMIL